MVYYPRIYIYITNLYYHIYHYKLNIRLMSDFHPSFSTSLYIFKKCQIKHKLKKMHTHDCRFR